MSQFEAFNDQGTLQFDADSYAFYYNEQGTFVVADLYIGGMGTAGYLNTRGSQVTSDLYDMAAFACVATDSSVTGKAIIPTSEPFYGANSIAVAGERITANDSETKYVTMTYWCFKTMKYIAPASHGVGMELYDANFQTAWTSLAPKPLLVVDNIIPTSNTTWTSSITVPSGKVYACYTWGGFRYKDPSTSNWYYPAVCSSAPGTTPGTGTINFKMINRGVDPVSVSSAAGGILVLDVTDY